MERSSQIMQEKNIFMVLTSSVTPQEDPKSVPLYSYLNQKWTFFVITQWSTTQRKTTQWSTTQLKMSNGQASVAQHNFRTQHNSVAQHNGAQKRSTAEHNTTFRTAQWSTAQQSKIHYPMFALVDLSIMGLEICSCELALSVLPDRKPLGNDRMHIRV